MTIKKATILIVTILCIIMNVGCTDQTAFDPKFEVAIITTSPSEEQTDIVYLDSDFNVVSRSNDLKYAAFDYSSGEVAVSNGKYYAAPKGVESKQDENKLVEIDLKTGQIDESYTNDKLSGPTSISCDDKYVGICANLNGKAYVGTCDKNKKDFLIKSFSANVQGCIREVFCCEGKILCFTSDTNENGAFYCYILDAETLEIEKKLTLKGYANNFYEYEGSVYFAEDATNDNEIPNYLIGEYSVKTGRLNEYPIESKVGVSSVKRWKSSLLYIDSDYFDVEKGLKDGRIVVTDLDGNLSDVVLIQTAVIQSIMVDNTLYILGSQDGTDFHITKYVMSEDRTIQKEKDIKIDDIVDDTTGISFFVNK